MTQSKPTSARWIGLALLVVALAALAIFISRSRQNAAPTPAKGPSAVPAPPDKVSVRLQWFPMAQFAGIYVAADKGFYRAAGLDVTVNPGGPDFNAITLVANGSDTFGIWTADQILTAVARGVPIKIVAAIYRKDPNVLLVRKGSGIRGPRDFVGKRVTTVYGRATESVLMAMLKGAGVDPRRVKIEPFPFNLQSFAAGKVDVSAAYSFDHVYQASKLGLDVEILDPADFGVNFYSDCLIVKNDLLEKNPGMVERFVHATLRGWDDALANRSEAIDIVLKRTEGLDRPSQEFMLEKAAPLVHAEDAARTGRVSAASLEKMKAILLDQGVMPADIDVASAFTNRFVDTYRKP